MYVRFSVNRGSIYWDKLIKLFHFKFLHCFNISLIILTIIFHRWCRYVLFICLTSWFNYTNHILQDFLKTNEDRQSFLSVAILRENSFCKYMNWILCTWIWTCHSPPHNSSIMGHQCTLDNNTFNCYPKGTLTLHWSLYWSSLFSRLAFGIP